MDRVLQWGISVHDSKLGTIAKTSAYLDHGIDIPPQASRVNGLTKQLLAEKSVDPKQAIGVLLQYLSKAGRVIAYNAPFDAGFLRAEASRLGVNMSCPTSSALWRMRC